MESGLEDYIYPPLGDREMRLFYLTPSNTLTGRIQGTLSATPLQGPGESLYYTTLSYAWGPSCEDGSHLTDYIMCGKYRLKVTPNLKQALQRIQQLSLVNGTALKRGSPSELPGPQLLVLWIDAICINQQDVVERSQQVEMMADIYKNSSCLLIWLGELSPGVLGRRQYDLLNLAQQQSLRSRTESRLVSPPLDVRQMSDRWHLEKFPLGDGYEQGIARPEEVAVEAMTDKAVLATILVRPWFRRRWVISEVHRASSYHTHMLLGEAVCHKFAFKTLTDRHGSAIRLIDEDGFGVETAPSMFFHHESSECSDPRDYVFALMHSFKGGGSIDVHYNQDVRDTYLTLVKRTALGISMMMDFESSYKDQPVSCGDVYSSREIVKYLAIASCKKSTSVKNSIESWVPDWRLATRYESNLHHISVVDILGPSAFRHTAMESLRASLHVSPSGYHYLHLTGTLLKQHLSSGIYERGAINESSSNEDWMNHITRFAMRAFSGPLQVSDRIWLTGITHRKSYDDSNRIIAFLLRDNPETSTLRETPVYQIMSCFLVLPLPRAEVRNAVCGLELLLPKFKRAFTVLGILVDEEFYLG